jgi:hypothetical protein
MKIIRKLSYAVALTGLIALPGMSQGGKGEGKDFDRFDRFDRLDRLDRGDDRERADRAFDRVERADKLDKEIEKAVEKSLDDNRFRVPDQDRFDRDEQRDRDQMELFDADRADRGLAFGTPQREEIEARADLLEEHARTLAEHAEHEGKTVELRERKGDIVAKDKDFPVSGDAKKVIEELGEAKGAFATEGVEKGLKEQAKAEELFAELPASEQKHVLESEAVKKAVDPTPEEREKFVKDKGRIGRFDTGDRFIGADGKDRGAKGFESHALDFDRDLAEAAKRAR